MFFSYYFLILFPQLLLPHDISTFNSCRMLLSQLFPHVIFILFPHTISTWNYFHNYWHIQFPHSISTYNCECNCHIIFHVISTYYFHILLAHTISTYNYHILFPHTISTYNYHILLPHVIATFNYVYIYSHILFPHSTIATLMEEIKILN
jgi:hypothetical protein